MRTNCCSFRDACLKMLAPSFFCGKYFVVQGHVHGQHIAGVNATDEAVSFVAPSAFDDDIISFKSPRRFLYRMSTFFFVVKRL